MPVHDLRQSLIGPWPHTGFPESHALPITSHGKAALCSKLELLIAINLNFCLVKGIKATSAV